MNSDSAQIGLRSLVVPWQVSLPWDCQVDEDLPYILQFAGEDTLMTGSDYTHRDQSMEHDFPRLLQERASRGEIPESAVQKILYDNAKTFYGL